MLHSRRPAGFTLAEVLIAITITLVIVTLLFQVFTAAARQWQSSDQRIDAFRDARAALQIIGRDLGRALVAADPRMLMLSDYDPAVTYAKEAYAISPIPNGGKSDLCALGYYCVWDPATKTFTLKRLFKDSNVAFPNLANSPPNFSALFTKAAANEEDMAAHVWNLQFKPGIQSDVEAPNAFPSNQWRWIEVRFKCMSPAAARKLKNLPVTQNTWSDNTGAIYQNTILPHEQQFLTRIALQQSQ
jgi:prepilin-type N-terminal cleavage/methylation domain-containing protein